LEIEDWIDGKWKDGLLKSHRLTGCNDGQPTPTNRGQSISFTWQINDRGLDENKKPHKI